MLVQIVEQYNVDAVQNENLPIVIELLEKLIGDDETICTCEHCILDIIAITLNNLPPRYRIGLIGKIDIDYKYDQEYRQLVLDSLHQAVMRVTENPHHLIAYHK